MNILKIVGGVVMLAAIAMFVYQCNGNKKKSTQIEELELEIKTSEEERENLKKANKYLEESLNSLKNKPDTTFFSENRIYNPKTKIKTVVEEIPVYITDTITGRTDTIYKLRPSQTYTLDTLFQSKDYDLKIGVEAKGPIGFISHQLTTKFKPEITVKEVTKTVVQEKLVEDRSVMTASIGWQAQTNLPERMSHGPMIEIDLHPTQFLTTSIQYNYLLKEEAPHMIQVSAKLPVFKKNKK